MKKKDVGLTLKVVNKGQEVAFRCPVCGTALIAIGDEGQYKRLSSRCYICDSVFSFSFSEWHTGHLSMKIETQIEVYRPSTGSITHKSNIS